MAAQVLPPQAALARLRQWQAEAPVTLLLLGSGGPFWSTFLTKMLPGAIYNTALALLIFPWLARFLRQERPITTFRRLG